VATVEDDLLAAFHAIPTACKGVQSLLESSYHVFKRCYLVCKYIAYTAFWIWGGRLDAFCLGACGGFRRSSFIVVGWYKAYFKKRKSSEFNQQKITYYKKIWLNLFYSPINNSNFKKYFIYAQITYKNMINSIWIFSLRTMTCWENNNLICAWSDWETKIIASSASC
jgi:hypothetical protein